MQLPTEPQLSLVTKTVLDTFNGEGYYDLPAGTTHLEYELNDYGNRATISCIKETPILNGSEIKRLIADYTLQLQQYQRQLTEYTN